MMDREFRSTSRVLPTSLPLPLSGACVGVDVTTTRTCNPPLALPPHSDQLDFESIHATNPDLNASNASPSRASNYSISSTATGTSSTALPPLKRKHGRKHMRQQLPPAHATSQSSTPLASTNTSLPPTSSQQVNPSPSSPSRLAQLQLPRSNTAPSPKRAPASHSSYGVETIAGPPPSFDTRRTISQERVWRVDRSKSLRMTLGSENSEPTSQLQNSTLFSDPKETGDSKQSAPATPALTQTSPDTADTQSVLTPTDAEQVAIMEMRNEHGLGVSNSEVGSKTSSESHKSEDLFLNIARVDAGRPTSSRGEKRRSRISLPFFSAARPATSYNPEGVHLQSDSSIATPRAEMPSHHSKRASVHLGQLRPLDQASEHGSADISNSGHYVKRSSTLYGDTSRSAQRIVTGSRNNRLVSEGGYLDRSKFGEQNATESTASTTAPSTVWDELDDLKSRIRKLELTGKLPPSSAAAMSSAERPRTATTAATTMSSSPNRNKVPVSLQATTELSSSSLQPLLYDALSNAQTNLSQDIYQKLLATAQDALQLASLTNFDGQSTISGAPIATDRQLRRRTESMCRSLTELAIALATENKPVQPAYQPASREYHPSPSAMFRSRRYSHSNEPMDRPPLSARVQSRIETRRVSTQAGFSYPTHTSPDLESPTALPQNPGSGSRATRVSATHRSRRAPGFFDGINGEVQDSPSVRPISRAMTDVATARRLSRDYAAASREYTSQHPMPSNADLPSNTRTPLPSNLSTNFTSRRKYPSPANLPMADSSPLASRQPWGRISVVQPEAAPPSDTVSEAPGPGRSLSTRRSFGLASRIGSSVGNRLRSAKAERNESRGFKDAPVARGDEGMMPEDTSREKQYPRS